MSGMKCFMCCYFSYLLSPPAILLGDVNGSSEVNGRSEARKMENRRKENSTQLIPPQLSFFFREKKKQPVCVCVCVCVWREGVSPSVCTAPSD